MINYLFLVMIITRKKKGFIYGITGDKKAKFLFGDGITNDIRYFISAGTSVYASDQLEDSEVEAVAKGLEEMYANGVTEDNFKTMSKIILLSKRFLQLRKN